ncbi:MAG TPA: tetratricopeptide repeat protein [Blastocatellia bacterium]|nr:tetratricopeptide repeat protein [Blastocatellia bacterium]
MKLTRSIIILLLAASPVFGQHHHSAPTDANPANLMPGLGTHHHPVSTGNAEAQKFFDQGLVLVYGFNHEEARRSFERATQLDPNLAMAWWGIALAVGPNYNETDIDSERMKAACDAIQKARSLAAKASEQERDYIEALAKRFSLDPKADRRQLYVDYKNAMGEVTKHWPDDLDAATMYAESMMNLHPWQLWTKDGKPAEGTEEIVAVLESVLKRDPQHIGANHYYIHAVEASPKPERALPSAARLGKLTPSAGHLVHMPAHIYIRTGDYESAAKSNEEAAAADRAYIQATGRRGMYTAMYYSHNLHFLVEAYGRAGQFGEAQRSAKQLSENVGQYIKEMPMVEGFLPSPLFVLLHFAKWDEILKTPEPDRSMIITNPVWHYARGVAFAATGKVAEAQKEQQTFAEAVKNLPGGTPFGLNSAESVMKIAESVLDARIAWAKGDGQAAIEAWRKAVAAQDALNYDEPPGWYYSVRESLGAALVMNGDGAAAEKVFREDLDRNPRNGRSLFGLVESLKAQKKDQAARLVRREFETAWKNADTKLRLEDL